MVMKQLALIAALIVGAGCSKPSEDSCRKAIANMQHLLGTEHLNEGQDHNSDVRSCRSGSSQKAVDCAIAAKTLDELKACDFMKPPEKK
jgi:hypothetical protein